MKRFIKNTWVILVCLSFGLAANAQKREFKLNTRTTDYAVIPLNDERLALCYKSQKDIAGEESRFIVSVYDKELNNEFRLKIDVLSTYRLIEIKADGQKVYMLLAVPSTRYSKYGTITEKVATKNFAVVEVDLEKKNHKLINGEVPSKLFAITGFEVTEDALYVAGHSAYSSLGAMFAFTGKKPKAMFFSAGSRDNEFKLQGTSYKGASLVTAIEKSDDNKSLNVIISNYVSKGEMVVLYIEAKRGRLGREEEFKFSGSRELVDFTFHQYDRKNKVLIGNWGSFNMENEGLFITEFGDKKGGFIKYHKYKNFDGFYDFVETEPGRNVNEEEKKFSALSKRKNFQYSGYVHKMHAYNKNAGDTTNDRVKMNFMTVVEAYYPEYKTETISEELDNGYTIQKQANVFYGYRYTHIMVANFKDDGEIDWNICLPIFNIGTYQIKPRVNVIYNDDNSCTITYGTEGLINQVTVKDGKVVSETQKKEELNNKELFIVKNNYSMDIEHWYDDYFIASGYKKFDYYAEGEKLIFFINKVKAGNTLDFQLQEEVTEDE